MIAYVCCWRKFVEVFKSCEGRREQGLQERLGFTSTPFVFFFPYSFAFTLFDFSLLYKKFTPNFATSSNVIRALKAS
jgi:hypothetical protein